MNFMPEALECILMKPAKPWDEKKFRKELVHASLSLDDFPSETHLQDLPKLAEAFEQRGGYPNVRSNYLKLVGKALASAAEETRMMIMLEKARTGDEHAREALVESFRPASTSIAHRMFPPNIDHESAANEALDHLSTHIFEHDTSKGSVRGFGFRILQNKLIDLLKFWKRRTYLDLPQQVVDLQNSSGEKWSKPRSLEYPDPDDSMGAAEHRLFFWNLVSRTLTPKETEVLRLRMFEELTLEETADALGWGELSSTVKKGRVLRITSRALDKLRSTLNSG